MWYNNLYKPVLSLFFMNKSVIIAILLVFVIQFGVASAAKTVISGTIYNSDYSVKVEGAYVEANCNYIVKNKTSDIDGSYYFVYNLSDCHDGDYLSVFASHPDYGSNMKGGIVKNSTIGEWDFAILDIPLVPEFGFFVGGLTILGAVGIFFFIRRK